VPGQGPPTSGRRGVPPKPPSVPWAGWDRACPPWKSKPGHHCQTASSKSTTTSRPQTSASKTVPQKKNTPPQVQEILVPGKAPTEPTDPDCAAVLTARQVPDHPGIVRVPGPFIQIRAIASMLFAVVKIAGAPESARKTCRTKLEWTANCRCGRPPGIT